MPCEQECGGFTRAATAPPFSPRPLPGSVACFGRGVILLRIERRRGHKAAIRVVAVIDAGQRSCDTHCQQDTRERAQESVRTRAAVQRAPIAMLALLLARLAS